MTATATSASVPSILIVENETHDRLVCQRAGVPDPSTLSQTITFQK